MKILVTGGAGFIGSNIVDAYVKLGHKVVVIDNLSTGNKRNVNPKAVFYHADITDTKIIDSIIGKERPKVVNHHAAQIDVRKSVNDPKYDASVNIVGALNVLESAKKYEVKKVIFASSGGTIYGECNNKPQDESAEARPLSPYGITKYAVEFYLKYYKEIQGIKYTVLRYGNVYGPRQDPHGEAGVVAIFSGKMLNNERLNIYGDGKQERDYVFVGDVVKANVAALNKADNNIINIGTGKAMSVNQLFKELSFIIRYNLKPVYKKARPGELLSSVLGIKKAKSVLKWQPSVKISSGLQQTVEYFRQKNKTK